MQLLRAGLAAAPAPGPPQCCTCSSIDSTKLVSTVVNGRLACKDRRLKDAIVDLSRHWSPVVPGRAACRTCASSSSAPCAQPGPGAAQSGGWAPAQARQQHHCSGSSSGNSHTQSSISTSALACARPRQGVVPRPAACKQHHLLLAAVFEEQRRAAAERPALTHEV